MKTKKFLFYLLATLLGGCIPSLHPLYTNNTLLFEEELLGTWGESDEYWKFKKGSGPNSYNLVITDENAEGKFVAHLVKIDKMLFLDLFPEELELQASDFYKYHLLPVHTFIKVEQIEPTLQMQMMDPDVMKTMLENDPNLIRHEFLEELDRIVLTASTKDLQDFMKAHANDEGLFGEPSNLERLKSKDPNDPNAIDPNETPRET